METRANYVLIGAFALAGFFGILAFFLWFANIQLDRHFAYYDIDFFSVSVLYGFGYLPSRPRKAPADARTLVFLHGRGRR